MIFLFPFDFVLPIVVVDPRLGGVAVAVVVVADVLNTAPLLCAAVNCLCHNSQSCTYECACFCTLIVPI